MTAFVLPAFWAVKLALLGAAFLGAYAVAGLGVRAGRRRRRARLLQGFLLAMGPLSIKIGQILGTHGYLLSEEAAAALQTLQDDVPPCGPRYVRRTLEAALERPLGEVFRTFDWNPVASASVAQVHRAELTSGRQVAVKVVRRHVTAELQGSLALLTFVVRAAHAFAPSLRQRNLPAHVAEVRALLTAQTDLLAEAHHQQTIRENFAGHPYVRVPEPYLEYCSRNVLVMEYVNAIRGLESHRVGLLPSRLACRFQHAFYTMVYLHGCFHADPHPGNVFFDEAGGIVLLDFGMVGTLTEEEKWGLSSFYYAATRHDWPRAVERFTRYFVVDGHTIGGMCGYAEALTAVLRRHFETCATRWSTVTFAEDANAVLHRFGARFTASFTKVVVALLSGEGFVALIDPDVDIWANARQFTDRASPYLTDAVERRFDEYFRRTAPGSLEWRSRAAASLVAPTHLDGYMVPSAYPLFVRRAEGCRLEDVDGNIYIDLACGFGPHILGYGNDVVREAVCAAAAAGGVNALGHSGEVELAELLVGAFPAADKAILATSGTEAVLQALRLCRAWRGVRRIAKFEGHYHGFSDHGLVSSWFRFAGTAEEPMPFVDMPGIDRRAVEDTLVLQYGTDESLAQVARHAAELACVVCEPMPSAMACYDRGFLARLRDVCTAHRVPLVFDEVVTGFRVAFGGIQTLTGIDPDLTCLGKVIGGGLPCGAVIGRRELVDLAKSTRDPFCDAESKVFVGGTMSGNAYSCAAGLATLKYLREHDEVYARLHAQTCRLATEFLAVARSFDVPLLVTGTRSVMTLAFDYRALRHVRSKHGATNHRANLGLAYYMRRHGVYLPELHTILLSAALDEHDLSQVAAAFEASLGEMVADGFFTT